MAENVNINMFYTYHRGSMLSLYVYNDGNGVVPVISLRSDTLFTTGGGTIDSPYLIES